MDLYLLLKQNCSHEAAVFNDVKLALILSELA